MKLPASLRWIGLALLGLLIATAVALAATGLISRQIGIDSESISSGDTLAPAFGHPGERHGGRGTSPPGEGNAGEPATEPENQVESEPGTGNEPSESEADDGEGGGTGKGEGPDD